MRKFWIVLAALLVSAVGYVQSSGQASAASAIAPNLGGLANIISSDPLVQNVHGWHCSRRFHPRWGWHRNRRACRGPRYGHRRYRSRHHGYHRRWRSRRVYRPHRRCWINRYGRRICRRY